MNSPPSTSMMIGDLSAELDFHEEDSLYASHNFHPFPAKFSPQLPRHFICQLTQPGDVVLDPMSGSGTTVLEAYLNGRQGVGCDIDPLALLITQVKTTPLDATRVAQAGEELVARAKLHLQKKGGQVSDRWRRRWDGRTQKFVDYWFDPKTQLELFSLLTEIERVSEDELNRFFRLAFSAVIITKTGGVSLALDLAHTRPHRVQQMVNEWGEVMFVGKKPVVAGREQFVTKTVRSAFGEFERRVRRNGEGFVPAHPHQGQPVLLQANAQRLPLLANSVDLIVTSPPYASNAIDYLRAHKFSLVWLGYDVNGIRRKRQEYIGNNLPSRLTLAELPALPTQTVRRLQIADPARGRSLHRYYAEMQQAFREMYRVLKPGKAAVVVVGNSIIHGQDTQTSDCLAAIGEAEGFELVKIGVRTLDRNRRMMPAHNGSSPSSPIYRRMTHEYIVGLEKQ